MSTPSISNEKAEEIALQHFGLRGKAKSLGSCQDVNFKLSTEDGYAYVIKVSSSASTMSELNFQNNVIFHLHSCKKCGDIAFPIPQKVIGRCDEYIVEILINDKVYLCRCLTFVRGNVLSEFSYFTCDVLESFGKFVATISSCLTHFQDSGSDRDIQWDLRRMDDTVNKYMSSMTVPSQYNQLNSLYIQCKTFIQPFLPFLRVQVVHGDLASYNVIANANIQGNGRPFISGVIDFGDAMESYLVGDLAVAILSMFATKVTNTNILLESISIVRGFNSLIPLAREETLVIWPLVIIRSIINIISMQNELNLNPDNEYNIKGVGVEWYMLSRILEIPIMFAVESYSIAFQIKGIEQYINSKNAINHYFTSTDVNMITFPYPNNNDGIAGTGSGTVTVTGSSAGYDISGMIVPSHIYYHVIDVSVTSTLYVNGNWLPYVTIANGGMQKKSKFTLANNLLVESLESSLQHYFTQYNTKTLNNTTSHCQVIYLLPYGSPILHLSKLNSIYEPDNINLGLDIFLPVNTPISSPIDGEVEYAHHLDKTTNSLVHSIIFHHQSFIIMIYNVTLSLSVPSQEGHDISSLTIKKQVNKGDICGYVAPTNHYSDCATPSFITLQVSIVPELLGSIPRRCNASVFPYWSQVCINPSFLLGIVLRDVNDKPIQREAIHEYCGASYLISRSINNGQTKVYSNSYTIKSFEQYAGERESVIQTRYAHIASVQEHYYKKDILPQIERGYQQFLYSTHGRAYLDMVNNVALIGHCHMHVNEQINKQINLLNTNSRFIYQSMSDFAASIISTIPEEHKHKLNVVLFVNSGSEATDLALRIARTVVTERRRKLWQSQQNQHSGIDSDVSSNSSSISLPLVRDVICFSGAYHGCSTASDEISTTLNDNPRALESRPSWIHLVPMPNLYRGVITSERYLNQITKEKKCNEDDAASSIVAGYVQFVKDKMQQLKATNRLPACFIAEPLSGNAGGVQIPYGCLKLIHEEVRAHGGLCISDEVQVGYGRLGNVFWGYEEHDVIPDIITMAKAAGNGHPIGYVITSREIADEFHQDGSFFSSAGGGPVSSVIGKAVLDVVLDEELQSNAHAVGGYLHEQLILLQKKYPHIVGCIHGHGLYQGIEIIKGTPLGGGDDGNSRRRNTDNNGMTNTAKEPGTQQAYAICERLLNLGVICHNTGDYSNVLKVKPPLVMTKENADFLISALNICLQGW